MFSCFSTLFLSLSVCLSISLTLPGYLCVSFYLFVCLSLCLSLCIFFLYFSLLVSLSLSPTLTLSHFLSLYFTLSLARFLSFHYQTLFIWINLSISQLFLHCFHLPYFAVTVNLAAHKINKRFICSKLTLGPLILIPSLNPQMTGLNIQNQKNTRTKCK